MITIIRCHGRISSCFYRLSLNLLKNHQNISESSGKILSSSFSKHFSINALSNSINKRLLEARNKLPKYPETLSYQSDKNQRKKDTSNLRAFTQNQQNQFNPHRSDPCKPHNSFRSPCPPLEGLSGGDSSKSSSGDKKIPLSSGDGDNRGSGRSKWMNWIITAITVAGCGGIIYLWILKPKTTKDSEVDVGYLTGSEEIKKRSKVPLSPNDIPKKVPYLLIGGGTASFSAFRAIKSLDPKAKVLLISNEFHKPYMRPPLSKELWFHGEFGVIPENYKFQQWNGATRSLYYEPNEFYIDPTKLMDNTNGGVAVCEGYEVKKIDVYNKKAILTDGTEIEYDKCLIATGCEPKNLDVFQSASRNVKEHITQYRTPEDFENLKKIIEQKKSVVIIGSGFLGSELSCALSAYTKKIKQPVKIYQIFHENGNIAQLLPEYLSKWTTRKIQEQGVCVIPYASVLNAGMMHNHLKLDLSNGQSILTDHVVICLGNEPHSELGKMSGLSIDKKLGGYIVNSEMEAKEHLFVAGDAASFEDPLLGRRRIESHDHAVISGRLAGENMTGKKKTYTHQAMFWSDLGPNIGFEGIGIVDSSLPTVGVFAKLTPEEIEKMRQISFKNDGNATEEFVKTSTAKIEKKSNIDIPSNEFEKGVIFYLRDEKIVGILLWNLFNRIHIARKIINENKKFEDLNEVAKLFEIHS